MHGQEEDGGLAILREAELRDPALSTGRALLRALPSCPLLWITARHRKLKNVFAVT